MSSSAGVLPERAVSLRRMEGSGWSRFMLPIAGVLVVVGLAVFNVNAEAALNGAAVECDGTPMKPGQRCVYGGGGGRGVSYEEEKENEAQEERIAYAGAGLCSVGIALFVGKGIATWRRYR